MPEINITISKDKFLPIYRPLILSEDVYDIDFLYGGRDSGKSRHIAMQLVVECLRSTYFRCLLIKKELYTIRGSQYQTIKDVIEEWGITHLFAFNSSRLEIVCTINGNGFYGKGLDDAGKVKSFANPSCCWIEEGNQITAEDFVIIQTSLRTNTGKVKVWFSFNPECEVTYSDFWLWQEYFSHTEQLSFTHHKTIETPKGQKKIAIRATHGTYLDNPYCSDERIALYESYKTSKNNAYWYQTYTLGLWGYRRPGGEFWKCFEEEKHTADIKHIPQLKNMTIHISVDSNVNPYVTVQVWQIDNSAKKLLQVDEIICEHPNNTAAKSAKKVIDYLDRRGYNQPVYIYGDPAANAKSTVDDEGRSFFDKFIGVIKASGYQFVNRVGKSAPSVSQSGAFINEIFEVNYAGWDILIDKSCRKSIEDYNMVVEDIDGKMLKKKVTNKETKVSYEKYGHCSDTMRYLITTVLSNEYKSFLTRRNGIPRSGGLASVGRVSKVTP